MDKYAQFVARIEQEISAKTRHTKTSIEKLARQYGIESQNEAKELTELAIVNTARRLAHQQKSVFSRFTDILNLYNAQVNLSHRTSQSMLLQQYSTPAPFGFLMGIFCGIDKPGSYYEPSAGNGLLTVAADPKNVSVNEIDDFRNRNLQTQGFRTVTKSDSSKIRSFERRYDAVLTNPPFGRLDTTVEHAGIPINDLDHQMAICALYELKETGKAAIIVGGHTSWDKYERITLGKNRFFLSYVFAYYNLVDIINVSGDLYSRQGTKFDVRLLLIDGVRKQKASSYNDPVLKPSETVNSYQELFERVMSHVAGYDSTQDTLPMKKANKNAHSADLDILELEADAAMALLRLQTEQDLGMPYVPFSQGKSLEVDTPDSMGYEIKQALSKLKQDVGDVDAYVTSRLAYPSRVELYNALSAEQIDSVALAIYNIERRGQGLIIGDQTGIGKGRIAAAMVRYGVKNGKRPIFITEKPNLFSDLYRDLKAIGSDNLVPFIVNAKESKTLIKDEDGNVLHEPPEKEVQKRIFASGRLPAAYHFVMLTYSQINDSELDKNGNLKNLSQKGSFLEHLAQENTMICDESHNAGGQSNTGKTLRKIMQGLEGITYLSATFAKRPDNMPLYAVRTCLTEANVSEQDLIDGIIKGGVALQEIISSQLVGHGQMIRRERSYEGIDVNYITLDEKEIEHRAISDSITAIMRDIIAFQKDYIEPSIEEMDAAMSAEMKNVKQREGTKAAGVAASPYFSKVFQVINQMLFSIKAESVAERAIMRLKQGMKPVIAFANTMGAFLEDLEDEYGEPIGIGSEFNADFTNVLMRGLDGVLRYSVRDAEGKSFKEMFDISTFPPEAQNEYLRIANIIKQTGSGISISPIDIIKKRLKEAGYTVAEVTGRKYELQLSMKEIEIKQAELPVPVGTVKLSPRAKKLIPAYQQFLNEEDLVSTYQRLMEIFDKIPGYRKTDGQYKEARVYLHYFNGSSDWYITEFDEKEDLLYGYAILNGDLEMAEFGSIYRTDLVSSDKKSYRMGGIELDFHWDEETTLRTALLERDAYTEPSPMTVTEATKVYTFTKGTRESFDNYTFFRNVKKGEILPRKSLSVNLTNGRTLFGYRANYNSEIEYYIDADFVEQSPINGLAGLKRKKTAALGRTDTKKATRLMGILQARKKENTNDAFRRYNNNEVDVLMINQSGSTGASAHAVPTVKVPRDKVLPRVMILLQAELDINTEVQKRGRINRTGQIYKPTYDYVFSAIPAEKRLMMMLQKKLKSLDANTTSNQRQSEALMKSDDFLNKFGDIVVVDYLRDYPEINEMLDDPLNLNDSEKRNEEDAAHRVSGRVAVLDTKMQEQFYEEILDEYNKFVAYKKQQDEYDLEVENFDLRAETIKKTLAIVGKGGLSAFGDNTYIEQCRVQNLKKPYSVSELIAIIQSTLGGKSALEARREDFKRIGELFDGKLNKELEDMDAKLALNIAKIPFEKKFKSLNTEAERDLYYQKRLAALKDGHEKKRDLASTRMINQRNYLQDLIYYFSIGSPIKWVGETTRIEHTPGVFMGFTINDKNPLKITPAKVTLRFALANSKKYIELPASYQREILAVKGASPYGREQFDAEMVRTYWQNAITKSTSDVTVRYIITGNLLQAFGNPSFRSKLITFTTKDGKTRKGIYMPETFEEYMEGKTEQATTSIKVPALKCVKIIRGLSAGQDLKAQKLFIQRNWNGKYKLYVQKSRSVGGSIYLDESILALVEDGIFNSVSNSMVSILSEENLIPFLTILQNKHGESFELDQTQLNSILDLIEDNKFTDEVLEPQPGQPVVVKSEPIPDATFDSDDEELLMLELEAEAALALLELEKIKF